MKTLLTILFTINLSLFTFCQELPAGNEQQLENQTATNEQETEDDTYLQELEQLKKNPLNLNRATAEELKQLHIITDLQIASLISYRSLLGNLVSIYELQAIPYWDIMTIKKILPFVTTVIQVLIKEEAEKRFTGGEHSFLLRIIQVPEKSAGYDKTQTGTLYKGSPQRIFFRYRYMYKNLLQFGVVGDKDAGEQFFKGSQKNGFDFYSAHFFARKIGMIKALAIGDFSVNMGQGLVQWQGLAFKKSAEVLGVKRQSAVLNPYSSAGEFYFHRGVGITLLKGRTELTVFTSLRKLNANRVYDTANNENVISSFLASGYNRTDNELADRNKLRQTSFGGTIIYRTRQWSIGANAVSYHFSLPVKKRDEPYNLYAINGSSWYNISFDYSYTYKNLHVFGEAAADKNFNKGFINGVLISVDTKIDIAMVQRTINKAYQSVNGNSFTENTMPGNETGFYAGVTIRPGSGWKVDAYTDIYRFPWLKYQVDAPGHGREMLMQVTYTANKQVELYIRYRNETKETNQPDNFSVTNYLLPVAKQNLRLQTSYKINKALTIRNRAEMLWYNKRNPGSENGFSTFLDFIYKPMLSTWSGVLRLQYFETDGYNSRIYAYENDIQYSYSIPSFSGLGYRYCITCNKDIGEKISIWLRWAQTIYLNQKSVGSGMDKIDRSHKSELKIQGLLTI